MSRYEGTAQAHGAPIGAGTDVPSDSRNPYSKGAQTGKGILMEQPETSGGTGITRPAGIMGRVRNSANAQLTQQKERATDGLGSVAQAVRQSTHQLREQQHDTIAQYIEQAADQLERLSSRLREKNVNELVDDAQRFARQRPALFIGSAFAIGLVGARFLKSSAERNADTETYALATTPAPSTRYGTSRPHYGTTGTAGSDYGTPSGPRTPYGGTEIR